MTLSPHDKRIITAALETRAQWLRKYAELPQQVSQSMRDDWTREALECDQLFERFINDVV